MKTIISILMLAVLCGCGGGSEPDDDKAGVMPVDCKAKPEVCK